MSKKRSDLITPDDPEFKEALQRAPDAFKKYLGNDESLDTLKGLAEDLDTTKVVFNQKTYPHFHVEYSIQHLSKRWSKIVFHFSKITKWDMNVLSAFLAKNIVEMNAPIEVSFSENPEFRNFWDVLIYTTVFEAPFIRDRVLLFIDRYPEFRANEKQKSS